MNVPDYISPLVAYRVWQWDNTGLKSLCGEPWHPAQPLAARCRVYSAGTVVGRAEAAHDAHDAPQANCTCGVYASKSLEHLRTTGYARYGIHGEVNLWGTVVEHEQGWRAQLAYPRNLFLPPNALPFTLAEIQSRFKTLTTYRIDIFVADPKSNVPLWVKDAGYFRSVASYLRDRDPLILVDIGIEYCSYRQVRVWTVPKSRFPSESTTLSSANPRSAPQQELCT